MLSGVHAILGVRGHGKSRLARALVCACPRLLCVDTLGEHSTIGRRVTPEELAAAVTRNPRGFRLALWPRGDHDSAYAEVEWLECIAASRHDVCLFVDEIDRWYPGARAPLGEGIFSIVQYGRHYNQSLVAVARRPAQMSKDIMSQGTLWILPMRGHHDCKAVMDTCSFDPRELNILEEKPDPQGGEPFVIRTEVARYAGRSVQVGEFNLERGALHF